MNVLAPLNLMILAKKLQQAKQIYETCVSALTNRGWKFDADAEKMFIKCGVNGDDLPMELALCVRDGLMVLQVLSFLPFKIKEDKVIECAVATNLVNYNLIDGSFDLNVDDGNIVFRLTSSYRDSLISESLINYMIDVSSITIDNYNEKFFALANGIVDLEGFVKLIGD